MKKQFVKLLLLAVQLIASQTLSAQSDYEKIIQNVIVEQKRGLSATTAALNSGTTTLMNNMAANGSFTDLAYPSSPTTAGDAVWTTHVSRLRQMALAYTFNGASLYNNATLYNKIVAGLQYWNGANYDAVNWYADQIGFPQTLGEFLVLMRGSTGTTQLPAPDENTAINYLSTRDDPSTKTGANQVDESVHWIYRGALTASASVVTNGVNNIRATMVQVAAGQEGINPDNAFLQHNSQLMIQGYGADYLGSLYDGSVYVIGTAFNTFTQPELDVAYRFAHNSFYAAARGKYKDFSLDGRGISRVNSGTVTTNIAAKAKRVDPIHAADFTNDSLRVAGAQPPSYNVATPYHIHYWTGDYTLHNRPAYSFSVRSNSTRTIKTESINGENLLGAWLSDGATCIRVQGDEYYNIFPTWDWNKVPGITMRQFATPQTNPNNTNTYGSTTFVGGVTDSTYGVSVYRQNNGSVSARKAWFFFDDEVVCLGAGIASTQPEAVATTVNQALLSGNVTIKTSGSSFDMAASTQQNFTGNTLNWIYHNQIGYYFPAGGDVTVSNQSQSGKWSDINTGGSTTTVTSNVFKLWMNHGAAPTNGSYAYVVVPGIANAAQMDAYNQSNIQILSNTANLLAVKHQALNVVGIAFSAAGTLSIPGAELSSVTVDKPCVLLIKNINTANVVGYISDPAQQYASINLTLNFANAASKTLVCALPSGDRKGASLKVDMNATAPPAAPSATLAVLRIGGVNGSNGLTGSSTLVSAGTPVHIDKFQVANGTFTYVSSVDLNAGATGDKFFLSPSVSEGYLTLSENKQWLSFMGYAAKSASGNVYDVTTNPSIARTLAMLKYDGSANLSTALANFPVTGNSATAQSSITADGSNLWCVTNSGNAMGVLYTAPGATSAAAAPSVTVSSTVTSNKSISIFGNDLYYVANGGSNRIGTVSATGGLPTSSGNTMTGFTLVSGGTAFTDFTPSQMVMFDMDITVPGYDVMYVANVSTTTTQSGIYKYCKQANGQWKSYGAYGNIGTDGRYFGITGDVVNGLPVLYVTRGVTNAINGSANQIVQLQEQAGYNATMDGALLASVGADVSGMGGAIRGLAFYPSQSYYYKGTGNVNNLSNWGGNPDGSGTAPANFSDDNQTFFITKSTNLTFANNLVISGSRSKLIIGNGVDPVSVTVPQGYAINAETDVYNKATLVLQSTTPPALHYLASSSTVSYAAGSGQTVLNMAYGNFSNPSGSTCTINGKVTVTGTLVQSGTLKGTGTLITATGLTNTGVLSPGNSPGLFTVQGNFSNASTGTLLIELSGTTAGTGYDQLAVSGSTTLNGTLDLRTINGFMPAAGQSFTVLTANAVTGTFQTVLWPTGVTGTITYGSNNVTVNISAVVLPLKLLDFTASLHQNETVQLAWATANEDNVSHFEVERSSETQSIFAPLLKQNAIGSGNHSYTAVDPAPVSGLNYYRLKMVDKDGRFSYSKTVNIKTGRAAQGLVVYPNPVTHTLMLSHIAASADAIIRISYADGKEVLTKKLLAGAVQSTVDVSSLKTGWYMLTLKTGKQIQTAAFVKQ